MNFNWLLFTLLWSPSPVLYFSLFLPAEAEHLAATVVLSIKSFAVAPLIKPVLLELLLTRAHPYVQDWRPETASRVRYHRSHCRLASSTVRGMPELTNPFRLSLNPDWPFLCSPPALEGRQVAANC
jgi:hypothetical protein